MQGSVLPAYHPKGIAAIRVGRRVRIALLHLGLESHCCIALLHRRVRIALLHLILESHCRIWG